MVSKLPVVKNLLNNKSIQGEVQAFLQGPGIFRVTLDSLSITQQRP